MTSNARQCKAMQRNPMRQRKAKQSHAKQNSLHKSNTSGQGAVGNPPLNPPPEQPLRTLGDGPNNLGDHRNNSGNSRATRKPGGEGGNRHWLSCKERTGAHRQSRVVENTESSRGSRPPPMQMVAVVRKMSAAPDRLHELERESPSIHEASEEVSGGSRILKLRVVKGKQGSRESQT